MKSDLIINKINLILLMVEMLANGFISAGTLINTSLQINYSCHAKLLIVKMLPNGFAVHVSYKRSNEALVNTIKYNKIELMSLRTTFNLVNSLVRVYT